MVLKRAVDRIRQGSLWRSIRTASVLTGSGSGRDAEAPADASGVTIGWVVFLQVGLLLYERPRYGTELPAGKWAAIVVILALQAYLVLVPNHSGSSVVAIEPAIDQAAPAGISIVD